MAKLAAMKYALAIVTAITLAAGMAKAHSLKELEDSLMAHEPYVQFVMRAAPPFTLYDDKGREVSLSGLKATVVVLNFLYTHCPDVCPLHMAFIADLQDQINRTVMKNAVQFISITTDPARDTPDVMSAYGVAQGLDTANWRFLTSGSEHLQTTRTLAAEYGLKFTSLDNDYQLHGVVTYVIDKSTNIRAAFHGLKVNPINIILLINALSNDIH